MTRINAFRNTAENNSVAWGKQTWTKRDSTKHDSTKRDLTKNTGALIFAAVLIICSVTVGCTSDKPKPVNSTAQIPVTQTSPAMPAPVMLAAATPASKPVKKVVPKKPATVNYTDKTTGLTFEYPRRYAIETGDAATDLLASAPIPMNFVQPGGVALAAVELPETTFANTDFSSAFFNVSVHKTLTADQCNQFAVPQPKIEAACHPEDSTKCSPKDPTTASTTTSATENSPTTASTTSPAPEPQGSKLLLGDLELRGTEAVAGEGTRQSDSKYFHVFQNGACYEFALNVTTVASEDGVIKHVDRDKVFSRLEQILATVKINPVTPEVTTATSAAPAASETPAQ